MNRNVVHSNKDGSTTTWNNVSPEKADELLDRSLTDPNVVHGADEPVVRDVVIPEG